MHRVQGSFPIPFTCYLISITLCFIRGATSDLEGSVFQYKQGEGGEFTSKYNFHRLINYEDYADINNAIAREKQLKKWRRGWKFDLIKKDHPEMKNLAAGLY